MATKKLTPTQIKKLTALAKERRELAAEILEKTNRKKELDEMFVKNLPEGETTELGEGLGIYVQPTHRFSAELFEAQVSAAEHPELYKLVPDLEEVKKAYSPNQMLGFKSTSHTVKVVDL